MKKKIPTFETDREAERFVDTADLSDYDLAGAEPVWFEFEKRAHGSICAFHRPCSMP